MKLIWAFSKWILLIYWTQKNVTYCSIKHDWDIWEFIQQYSFDNALEIQLVWTVTAQQLRNASFLPQHKPRTSLMLCIRKKHQQLFPLQQNMVKNEEDVRVKTAILTLTEWSQYTVEIHSVQNLVSKTSSSKYSVKCTWKNKIHLKIANLFRRVKSKYDTGSTHCFEIKLTIR